MQWLFFLLFSYASMIWAESSPLLLPTYFQYTEQELEPISRLNSNQTLNIDELINWDKKIQQGIIQNNLIMDQSLIYAYLFVAQQDFALLSYRLKQRFEGSFTPVTRQVWGLFSKQAQDLDQSDTYSNALAALILDKIQQRFNQDLQSRHPYPFIDNYQSWKQNKSLEGLSIGTWKTWILTSGQSLRVSPPPPARDPFWQKQLSLVHESSEKRTQQQERVAYFWTNSKPKRSWYAMSTCYMQKNHISLPLFVVVRAVLSMGLEDTWIASFDSKYTYWVKRPDMLDPALKTLRNPPHYPSYPAEYSALSAAAATILNHFFPQSNQLWVNLAHHSGVSRVWCGLHFPTDHQVGIVLGERVGQSAIRAFEQAKKNEQQ